MAVTFQSCARLFGSIESRAESARWPTAEGLVTDRQAIALARPQARAEDLDTAAFRRVKRVPGGVLVSILTVNR
jgi:hypothetical protein